MMIHFLVLDECYSLSPQGSVISVEEGAETQSELEEGVGIKW